MENKQLNIAYQQFADAEELPEQWQSLLHAARGATQLAYAPYSNFHVAAAAFVNGKMVTATNQENASFPVGLCAERTLLSVLSTQFSGQPIEAIAVSYHNHSDISSNDTFISPCGLCRQTLLEFEQRNGQPIALILGGQSGEVVVINSVIDLLPFSFSNEQLK